MDSSSESSEYQASLAPGTQPTTVYDSRPPSPPPIEILVTPNGEVANAPRAIPMIGGNIELEPAEVDVSGVGLSPAEMRTITGGRLQLPKSDNYVWSYQDRHLPHQIIDFLWIGPSSLARKPDLWKETGFTMILVVNAMRRPGQTLRHVDEVAADMGIEVQYVDPQPAWMQVPLFNEALQLINSHMLAWEQRRANLPEPDLSASTQPAHPKVLVVCETGNERSGIVAASYLMAMYSLDVFDAVRFTLYQRLSCYFDDGVKRALRAWEDILRARSAASAGAWEAGEPSIERGTRLPKRDFAETMETDLDGSDSEGGPSYSHGEDRERFENRGHFAPFRDVE